MPASFRVAASLLALVLIASPSVARTWTNDEGQTLEADFVRLRGTVALLRDADRKIVSAPIARLSEADRQWIDAYKAFLAVRVWGGDEERRYRLQLAREDHVRVEFAGETAEIPYAELTAEDFAHVESYYNHAEKELPAEFAAAQQAAGPVAPSAPPEDAIERQWTDARGRSLTALYAGTEGAKAILWIKGKRYEYPLARLSDDDRAWVAQQKLAQLTADVHGGWSAASSIVSTAMAKTIAEKGPPPMAMAGPPAGEFSRGFTPQEPPYAPPEAAVAEQPAPDVYAYESPEPPAVEGAIESPPPVNEPVSAAPGAAGTAHPERGAPPWIDDFNDLSNNEIDARLREAFGDWVDNDEAIGGDAYCSHCDGEFIYPEGFAAGSPCPFCGVAMAAEDLDDWEDDGGSSGGLPWYLRRGPRRIIVFLVITIIGAGVKLAMGMGGDDE